MCSDEQRSASFNPDDVCRDRIKQRTEAIIDAIEETFLAHLPPKALSYCAQEDVNTGLDAMRERFKTEHRQECQCRGCLAARGDGLLMDGY